MKETVAGEYRTAALEIAEPIWAALEATSARLTGKSLIAWGEHCSECAYPACYSSCAFYTPRPDLHCRRFEGGIEEVRGSSSKRQARLIRFRRWGKLEGRGPAGLHPMPAARRLEQVDRAASRLQASAPLPYAVTRNLVWRWNERKSARAGRGGTTADAFVVEAWSVDGATHGLTLTFLEQDGEQRLHQTRFEAGPTYSRLEVPVSEIAARIDLDRPFLIQIEPVGDAEGRAVAFGVIDFCAFAPSAQAPAPSPAGPPLGKVLVWDLDETLWTGVLAEDGVEGVTPRPEAIAVVKALDARGVLQSVASKNDPAEAARALEAFGLSDYFLHPQVGWGPKSEAVARVAKALDLGLDSFVFIDDQPFERGEVEAAHPTVRTLAHTQVAELVDHPWFAYPVTAESARRRSLYRAEAERSVAFQSAETDYIGFLRASKVRLQVSRLGPADVVRIYELSQRTNQLNFTGAKLSQEEVERRVGVDPERLDLVLRCEDRFGDYGVIGFAAVDLTRGELEQFFMSCRVQRKRVEHAAFSLIAERLRAAGRAVFRVRYRATERNTASSTLLTDLGFTLDPADASVWTRSTHAPFPDADVVSVDLGFSNLR